MEKIVRFEPGYDSGTRERGIGSMQIRFVLKGELGAVQILFGTDWYPRSAQERLHTMGLDRLYSEYLHMKPDAWDVGYHSPTPQYEGHTPSSDSCEFLDGKPCYYDGSSLAADPVRDAFLEKGEESVWAVAKDRYIELFGELR